MNNANVRVEATNQITCALGIEESDVFFNEAIVEVTAKVPRDPLTQNVVDGGSHTHTDSRELIKKARLVSIRDKVDVARLKTWLDKFED